ncbi:MAG: AGE family epimerase/isomerase, partial [Clostridia bacterium]
MKGFQAKKLHQLYRDQLLNDCIPFWLDHSLDRENGGYFTCLDQKGKVYSTDKPVWFQGRGLWLYAKLCNTYGIRDEWLDAARLGYRFLNEHCFDDDGRMFFQLTADGKPLRKRRYMFSETFAVIAFAEYAKATGDKGALEKARKVYDLVVSIYRDPGNDPYRMPPKFNPAVRPMKAMAVPMILLNTNHVLRDADGERAGFYDQMARVYINDILNNFFKPDCKALLETVGVHGERLDTPMGRVVNPGHAIEAAWFLMHEALHFKDDIT